MKKTVNKVKVLWNDSAIKDTWEQCRNYQIQVSQFDYLMDNLDRIASADFTPNNDDIIRSRQRTTGSFSTRFSAFNYNWTIIDVGGQAPERIKWKQIMENSTTPLTAIIYFAALDEYNMTSNEEENKTKMEVSLEVFKQLVEDSNHCMILFLNKTDLFQKKINNKKGYDEFVEQFNPDFKEYLKSEEYVKITKSNEYKEHERKYLGAYHYIRKKFEDAIPVGKPLSVYPTCAIDTDQVRSVFIAIKDYIFVERMKHSGINF